MYALCTVTRQLQIIHTTLYLLFDRTLLRKYFKMFNVYLQPWIGRGGTQPFVSRASAFALITCVFVQNLDLPVSLTINVDRPLQSTVSVQAM